jgi:hypothetical protein
LPPYFSIQHSPFSIVIEEPGHASCMTTRPHLSGCGFMAVTPLFV